MTTTRWRPFRVYWRPRGYQVRGPEYRKTYPSAREACAVAERLNRERKERAAA